MRKTRKISRRIKRRKKDLEAKELKKDVKPFIESKEENKLVERSLKDFHPTEIENAPSLSIVISEGGRLKTDAGETVLWGYHLFKIWPSKKPNGNILAQTAWGTMLEFKPCYPILLTPLKFMHYVNSLKIGEKISRDLKPPKEYLEELIKLDIEEEKKKEVENEAKVKDKKETDWAAVAESGKLKKLRIEQTLNLLTEKNRTKEEIMEILSISEKQFSGVIKALTKKGHKIVEKKGAYSLIS